MKHIGSTGTKNYWMPEDPNKPLRLTREMKVADVIYLHNLKRYVITSERRVFEITGLSADGQDYLSNNNELAVEDELLMTDKRDGGGVGLLSLGKTPFDEAFGYHDFKYSSKAYQEKHTREEADNDLLRDMLLICKEQKLDRQWEFLANTFYLLCRQHGGALWEDLSTCWRKRKIREEDQ